MMMMSMMVSSDMESVSDPKKQKKCPDKSQYKHRYTG